MDFEILKNEILKNGGITLVKGKKMEYKSGFIVSKLGHEYTTTSLTDATTKLMDYMQKFNCCGCWLDNGIYYIDANEYYNKNEHKKAIQQGIKNKQLAIFNIATGKSEYLQQAYYIIYKYNKIKNDFIYIKEFTSIDNITQFLKVQKNTIFNNINNNIDNVKSLINGKYCIIKELDAIEY